MLNNFKNSINNKSSKVKGILETKKTDLPYKTINQSKLDIIRDRDKNEFLKKISIYLKDSDTIGYISDCLDDYNIEKKTPIPTKIVSDEDVLKLVEGLKLEKQEHFVVITLDSSHQVINNKIVSKGVLNQLIIEPREVFAAAIEDRAKSIIVVHNHPSGNTNPSKEDINVTDRLKYTSEIVGIKLLDHIIIGNSGYYSFNGNNLL